MRPVPNSLHDEAASRLRRRLRELTPADRLFFRDALRRLPEMVGSTGVR